MRKREIFIEFTWLLALLIISFCIDFFIFGRLSLFRDQMDIQMHDTYYIISGIKWFLGLFFFLSTLVYMIKESVRRFSHSLSNVILTILLISTLFLVLQGHRFVYAIQHMQGGWKVYPPLSAMPEVMETIPAPPTPLWSMLFIGIELLMVLGLFLLGFKTGRSIHHIRRESLDQD